MVFSTNEFVKIKFGSHLTPKIKRENKDINKDIFGLSMCN